MREGGKEMRVTPCLHSARRRDSKIIKVRAQVVRNECSAMAKEAGRYV